MKRYFKNGEERIWIAPDEIEEIMSSELNKAGLMPDLSNPVVNLEAFVESHLKVHFDSYATLDPTVLGETEFRVGAPPKVSINKDLTGAAFDFDETAPGILGRWRATVAHEASHVIVHKCLFSQNEYSHSLFDDPETAEPEVQHLQRCLKREVMFRNISSDWKEIQANMGMAALLMPRELFLGAFRQELALLGLSKAERGSNIVTTLVDKIAMRFQVSKQATGIRLESLQLLSAPGQIDLIDL